MNTLNKLRDRIDWIDSQIAVLLNERMNSADQIGKIKRDQHMIVADPSRENHVLNQVEAAIQHPVLKGSIGKIYDAIMAESKIAQQFFLEETCPFKSIGIIGLGLIGGSICKALKVKCPDIKLGTICYPSKDYDKAISDGWIDHSHKDLSEMIEHSELIFLATPISTITGIAEEMRSLVMSKEKILVMDAASVKREIVDRFELLTNDSIEFVGTHPMAGKETSGFINSQATLFTGNPWAISPHRKNHSESLLKVVNFIRFLGAHPYPMAAEAHDRQAALISHLPRMIAKAFFDFVVATDPESILHAGPGFKSFTRLAHDSQDMCDEIARCNNSNIKNYLVQWLESMK